MKIPLARRKSYDSPPIGSKDYFFSIGTNKMAVTMVVSWFCLALLIVGSQAAGEFDVIHSPRSLKFTGSSRTLESLLKEIFSASLGLSVEEDAEWDGLSIIDPFTTPEAVVEIYVDGVSSLGNLAGLKSHAFPLTVDEYEPDTFEAIQHRIKQRFSNGGNKLVKIKLSDPNQLAYYSDVFGEIKAPKVAKQTFQHLKYSVEEDYSFLEELEALKAITAKVASGIISADNIIDFYNFRFQSLHALSDFHGPNSVQVKEAKKLLGQAIGDLSLAFVKAYDGSVLVTTVTTDVAHSRRVVRQAGPPPTSTTPETTTEGSSINSTPESGESEKESITRDGNDNSTTGSEDAYSADYAAIFNIILWFSVVFAFSLVAIVYAIMDMDPGRDSIIYRMTSTRMKKDN